MKIIFAGTPQFAAAALSSLCDSGHEIALALTQPDRPAGRGMALLPSPVKQVAIERGIELLQPQSLKKQPEIEARLAQIQADVMVVAAYGLILPQSILDIPRLGCINIHASLLPRWRGAAPIHRALMAGDRETGITLMQMDAGLDTGAMLLQRKIPIADDDTTQSLHDKMAELGAQCIVQLLATDPGQRFPGVPQDEHLATYAAKIEKSEALISWSDSAEKIERMVRGFNPFPVATGVLGGVNLKIWQARRARGAGRPGEILEVGKEGILVACGTDALRLEILQKPGGKKLPAAQFIAGFQLATGDCFGS